MKTLITIACIALFTLNSWSREVITLQTGWKFSKGNPKNAALQSLDDSKWQDVRIPHDWAIYGPVQPNGDGNTGKLPWRDEAWYRKALDIKPEWNGKTIYLVFDGTMSNPEIFINGKLAGKWDYGYNSFYFDVTPFLNFKEKNELAIHVDNRQHDSRWYPGAGIYRKVQMIVADPVHVAVWGTQVTTPIVKPQFAEVRVAATFRNRSAADAKVKIENIILNPAGQEVARKEASADVLKGSDLLVETTLDLQNPQRWDIDNPVSYQVKTIVSQGNQTTDIYYSSFGVRTMRFTADNGFYLNDKRVQMKGVCLHHDQGPLGGAFYPRAMERQLEIMKAMGCNAISTSHNVPAPELLDLCDRMGILVFNEAFDKYDGKADIHRDTDFDEFAQRNIQNYVERDRNHLSIFI